MKLFAFLLYLAWIPVGSWLAVSQRKIVFYILSVPLKKPNPAQELDVIIACVHTSVASFPGKYISYIS